MKTVFAELANIIWNNDVDWAISQRNYTIQMLVRQALSHLLRPAASTIDDEEAIQTSYVPAFVQRK